MRTAVSAIFLLAMGAFGQNLPFHHDGLNRQYRIHIPENREDQRPSVVILHGYSGNNNDMISNYEWVELADERRFAVACPTAHLISLGTGSGMSITTTFILNSTLTTMVLWSLWLVLQDLHDLDANRTYNGWIFQWQRDIAFQLLPSGRKLLPPSHIVGMMLDPLFRECAEIFRLVTGLNGTIDDVTLYNGDLDNTGVGSIPRSRHDGLWRSILGTTDSESVCLPSLDPGDGSVVQLETNQLSMMKHFCSITWSSVVGMTGRANLETGTSARSWGVEFLRRRHVRTLPSFRCEQRQRDQHDRSSRWCSQGGVAPMASLTCLGFWIPGGTFAELWVRVANQTEPAPLWLSKCAAVQAVNGKAQEAPARSQVAHHLVCVASRCHLSRDSRE